MLIRMGRVLGRFQRERGMALARPVAANSPLQSYFIDPDFAAVATSQMFGEGCSAHPKGSDDRHGALAGHDGPTGNYAGELCRRWRNLSSGGILPLVVLRNGYWANQIGY